MSSSLTYTLTKLRNFPWSLYRWALRPLCLVVKSTSSSPTVLPSASTASFLSVNGRRGVGIMILVAIELALFKFGTVFFQKPDCHVSSLRGFGRLHAFGATPRQAVTCDCDDD